MVLASLGVPTGQGWAQIGELAAALSDLDGVHAVSSMRETID